MNMYKIRIHLLHEDEDWDLNTFIEIELPFVPRKDEYVEISEEDQKALSKAIKESENAYGYGKYIHGFKGSMEKLEDMINENRDAALENLMISHLGIVENVWYVSGEEYIRILLDF